MPLRDAARRARRALRADRAALATAVWLAVALAGTLASRQAPQDGTGRAVAGGEGHAQATSVAPTPAPLAAEEADLRSDVRAAPAPQDAGARGPAERAVGPPVAVQVNARPWASVRVDGRDVGPTPLGQLELAPGSYEFEARFADGRTVRQRVEISAERRFVVLR